MLFAGISRAASLFMISPTASQSFDTVESPEFVTQMLAPSKAIPLGTFPTAMVPRLAPSLALSFVTGSNGWGVRSIFMSL
jgi:hypothetical protein